MSDEPSPIGSAASEQVKLEEISRYYAALVTALTESGLTGEALNEFCSRHISAECVQCGIFLKSEELNRVALAGPGTTFSEDKLERLRQGYCGRRDCNSYFYRLNLPAVPGIDWESIKANVRASLSEGKPAAEEKIEASLPKKAPAVFPLGKITLVIGLAFVLLIFKWWWWDGSIPLLQKKTTYEVDPKSTQNESSE